MAKIKAILFDLDGTLTDSALDLALAVNHMLVHLGQPEQPVEGIYRYIGRGVKNMIRDALGIDDGAVIDQALIVFRDYYYDHCLDNTVLYDGVMETIDALGDYKLAVVTNKGRKFTDKILDGLAVTDRFDAVLGADDYPRLKPNPEPVLLACEKLGVQPGEALMVGDSVPDIKSAQGAGALFCGVTYGLGDKGELEEAGAENLIDSMDELPDVITIINRNG